MSAIKLFTYWSCVCLQECLSLLPRLQYLSHFWVSFACLYAHCFCFASRLMCVFTQGWLCLVEVILFGTCLFTMDFRPALSDCHISSTAESVEHVCRIGDVCLAASVFISVKFDFDQRNTFLLIGLARVMVAVISRRIAAWSFTRTISLVQICKQWSQKLSPGSFSPGCLHVLFGLGPLSCSENVV